MYNLTTRSIWEIAFQNQHKLGVYPETDFYITLNNKFGIRNVSLLDNIIPRLNILTMGISPTLTDSTINKDTYRPSPLNTCLHNHVPFILRPIYVDLSPSERELYRLRTILTISGKSYAAYYGIIIPVGSVESSMILLETDDESLSPTIFDPALYDVNTNVYMSGQIIKDLDPAYVLNSLKLTYSLPAYVLRGMYDAHQLLHPGEELVVGEYGLCTAKDGLYTTTVNGETTTIPEVAECVLSYTLKQTLSLRVGGITGISEDDPIFEPITIVTELGGLENVIIEDRISIS